MVNCDVEQNGTACPCRMRDIAAQEVAARPSAAVLLKNLLDQVLLSDSDGDSASDASNPFQPGSESESGDEAEGSGIDQGGLVTLPPQQDPALEGPTGAQWSAVSLSSRFIACDHTGLEC